MLGIVFWPLLTGYTFLHTGVIYSDLMLFNYPLKDWYRGMLLEGKLPFWTSLVGNGFPVFAELQIGALYPFHLLLFRFLPTISAYNINLFLHLVIAALGTYAFSRISLKLSRKAALLTGITYSLSGFLMTHLHQTNIILVSAYLPLVLLCIERLAATQRLHWMFGLAILEALQILAGYIEFFYYSVLLGLLMLLGLVFFFPDPGMKKRKAKPLRLVMLFFLAILMAAGISMAQLLPTWELTEHSQRAEGLGLESASATVWPLKTLSLFVNPFSYDLYRSEPGYHPSVSTTVNIQALYGYVGILPLVFAVFAIISQRKKRFVLLFSILLLGAFVYGLGRSTQIFSILWETLPGLKFFRYPVKILFFIDFCLAILAGFGFDGIATFLAKRQDSQRQTKRTMMVAGVLVLAFVFADLSFNNVFRIRTLVADKVWFSPPPVAEYLQKKLAGGEFRYYTHGTNNIDYQLARNVEMQKEFQNILPVDFNLLFRLPANREWFALLLERQQRLNQERTMIDSERGVLSLTPTFKKALALQSVRYLVADLPIEDPDLKAVQEIPYSQEVGHSVYLSGEQGLQTVVVPARATHVYEYSAAYPRALFVTSSRAAGGGDVGLVEVLSEDFDPRDEVILEEEAIQKSQSFGSGQGSAEILNDEETQLDIQVNAESDGYLVVSDTYYPGWQAQVDGTAAPIYRANYAFRAVPVQAGKHTVRFRFEPTQWRVGLVVSGMSLAMTMFGLGVTVLRKM